MIAENIAALRKSHRLSQEKMAGLFGVSRQAIQKWESGAAVPEVSKPIDMAKTFGVSLDSLLCGEARTTDEIRFEKQIEPSYHALEDWENYACLLETEYVQCMEEGRDVMHLHGLLSEITKLPNSRYKEALADTAFALLMSAPQQSGYAYYEPSDYKEIYRVSRHTPPVPVKKDSVLLDKIK